MAPCPVCHLHLSLEEMNGHLDKCLATDNKSKEKPIDCFDDGCDADLLAATIDLEELLGDDTAFVNWGCNKSDSDDDEPLVKRPKSELHDRNSTRNNDDLFGDITVQNDLDLLAALENEEDTNQLNWSMFTYPVCDKLLSHVDMNSHLDGCLS